MLIDSGNYFQSHPEQLINECHLKMEHFNLLLGLNVLWNRSDSIHQIYQDEFDSYKVYEV
jgi:hypothetical protein